MSTLRKVFYFSLIAKLLTAAIIPLTNDEAYYWVWSQHMQLSFFDHPPFVAWLMWLGQQINVFGNMVRWPGVLLGHGMLALWLLILRPYLTAAQRLYWLGLALCSPMLGGTQLIVTPDLPLLFFYALSLLLFYSWRSKPGWKLATLFGLSMGLGFTSKYVMVLFPISLFPLVYLSRELRAPLRKDFLWIFLGAALGASPVWIWNVMNHFSSFRFQAEHGLGRAWKPSWTYEYVLLQVAIIFPPIVYWALRARKKLPLVFNFLAWVPLGFFLCTTFRGYAEANWPIVAYPAVFALAVATLPSGLRSIRITLSIWGTAFASLFFLILVQPSWSKNMKLREFNQFNSLIPVARELQPLFARSYQMAARLNYDLQRPIYKLKGMNRRDFYDFLEESTPKVGGAYYLAVEKGDNLPAPFIQAGHKVIEVLPVDEKFEIWRVLVP